MLAGCKKKEDPASAELKAQMQEAEQKQEVATTATMQTEAQPYISTETTTTEDGFIMMGTVLTGYSGTNTNITIPDSVTSIEQGAFRDCTSLTNVTIPNSVTSIETYAFQNCFGLASVTIPNSVTSIDYGAFFSCTSLASVTIPDSVTSIGKFAFNGCTSLASVIIPNSVTSIVEGAFSGCTSLASVTIPNSVQEIWADAFTRCTSLASVTFQGTIAANNFGESQGIDHVRPPNTFDGDLQEKYLAGGIGTYTTTAPVNDDSKWTKQ
jgi:hypothetical protein